MVNQSAYYPSIGLLFFLIMVKYANNKSVINVPLQLIKDFKRDKSLSELLAFAIIIKMNHPDGRLGDLKIRTIANLLHCSPERAMKILKNAKNNQQLFSYNKWTDSLTARDLKKPFIQQTNNHGHKAYQVYCVKYAIKEDISLNNILKQFKFTLIENAINAVERKDEFEIKSKKPTSFKPQDALTQRKLANIIGVKSKSTVCRKMKKPTSFKPQDALTQRKLANIIGVKCRINLHLAQVYR